MIVRSLNFLHELFATKRSTVDLTGPAVILSGGLGFLRLYYVIAALGMQNHVFTRLCSEREMFHWTSFESTLLRLLVEEPVMQGKFLGLQDRIVARPSQFRAQLRRSIS
jgi:hypothetical protein